MERFFQGRFRPARMSGAEILFIIVTLVLGGCAVFIIPPSEGYDEDQHLLRVWEMSALRFIPNESLGHNFPYPATFQYMLLTQESTAVAWNKYSGLRMDGLDYIYSGLATRSIYSPLLLFPQSIVMRYLGRALNSPVLVVFYGCRLASLLSYLILGWLAIRIAPFGKRILAVTALVPIALFEAATVSADPISNGIGLFFIACCLSICARPQLGWRHWVKLLILFALLFLAKPNMVSLALLPILLLSPSRFSHRSAYVLLLIAGVVLGIVEAGGWLLLASQNTSAGTGCAEGANLSLQLKNLISAPLGVVSALFVDSWVHGLSYLQGWIATYSHPLPSFLYWFFIIALGLAIIANSESMKVDRRTRLSLVFMFVIAYLTPVILLYMTCSTVGSKVIFGLQGRYFIVAAPLIFLSVTGFARIKFKINIPTWIAAIPLVLSILLYLYVIAV